MANLPPELIREILETSASDGLSQAAILAAISRDLNDWIKPILHKTLMCYNAFQELHWPASLDDLPEWLPVNGKYVQNIIWGIDTTVLPFVFSQCPGLTKLALWVDTTECRLPELLPSLSTLHLTYLSVDLSELFDQPKFLEEHARHDILRTVTHLDLVQSASRWGSIIGISFLPCLTHLSFPRRNVQDSVYQSLIRSVLEECKSLKVLALVLGTSFTEDGPIRVVQVDIPEETTDDPRLVAFDCDYVGDWLAGATGQKDMWALADKVVEQRLRVEKP